MLTGQGLTSADSGEPTGAETPADALGVTKRMSANDAESQESYECPTCPRDGFGSQRAMRLHHYHSHDESIAHETYECEWCGDSFEELDIKSPRFCSQECADQGRVHTNKPWTDEDTLRELYLGQELTSAEIAEELGCSRNTAMKWVDEFNLREDLDRYNCQLCGIGNHTRHGLVAHMRTSHDKDDFTTLVQTECERCGQEIRVKPSVYEKTDKNYCGPECRNIHKGAIAPSGPEHPQYDSSEYECANCGSTVTRAPSEVVGEVVACSRECFAEGFDFPKGPDHPSWQGGYRGYYGPDWSEKRRKVRERDGFSCQGCGASESELNRELSVHHIRPLRTFDSHTKANQLENLVSLCRSCHKRWEGIPLRPQTE